MGPQPKYEKSRDCENVSNSASVANGLDMRSNILATHISRTQHPKYLCMGHVKHLKY
jgi:hypothetical protein